MSSDSDVVAGVDGSAASLHAGRWAAEEASRRNATLRLVHCFAGDDQAPQQNVPPLRLAAERLLTDAADRIRAEITGDVTIQTRLLEGSPPQTLTTESQTASLLVVSTRGHGGFTTLVLGSTAVHLAAQAVCPVAIVSESEVSDRTGPVVVGVDGSESSQAALRFACARASARGVGLLAVHAWQTPYSFGAYPGVGMPVDLEQELAGARRMLANMVRPWQQHYPGLLVEQQVVYGHPVEVLTEATGHSAELLVVGSRGRNAWSGLLLGSVSQGMLRHCSRPVVIAR